MRFGPCHYPGISISQNPLNLVVDHDPARIYPVCCCIAPLGCVFECIFEFCTTLETVRWSSCKIVHTSFQIEAKIRTRPAQHTHLRPWLRYASHLIKQPPHQRSPRRRRSPFFRPSLSPIASCSCSCSSTSNPLSNILPTLLTPLFLPISPTLPRHRRRTTRPALAIIPHQHIRDHAARGARVHEVAEEDDEDQDPDEGYADLAGVCEARFGRCGGAGREKRHFFYESER
ncbi:hypothetical protein BDV96DRAFT_311186 [Lophiotrema nucula]|uniref:Uncharacterized protein n=1 Tax=Lophiotrema nucula TaxID=690887 RepID=A0A6A5YL63_9PLEO|nr:hypothetical protein BDV96DRAFT_311186 [Lophiotrema nucula]